MDVPLQIIDRYKHLQENKLVFGKMRSTLIAWLVQKLLVNVQEAENGYDSMWHRDADNDQAMFTEHFAMVRIKMLTLVRNSLHAFWQ